MLQLKSERDYVLSFTPQSNEFTITVPSSANMGHTAGLCGNTFLQNIPDHLHFLAQCLSANICCLPPSFTQDSAERINSMSFLYVMAAQPQTSLGLSQTGLTIKMAQCAYRQRGQCVLLGQPWDVRPFALRFSSHATHIYLSRCSSPSVRSRRVSSQMCVSLFLPTPTSVGREVYALPGGAPTSAVSQFVVPVFRYTPKRNKTELLLTLFAIALQCPTSMEYDACRTGCIEDCSTRQTLPGDWLVARGNRSACMDTPTEGCFCTGGSVLHHGHCVSPEACRQCVDQQGRTYAVRQM